MKIESGKDSDLTFFIKTVSFATSRSFIYSGLDTSLHIGGMDFSRKNGWKRKKKKKRN